MCNFLMFCASGTTLGRPVIDTETKFTTESLLVLKFFLVRLQVSTVPPSVTQYMTYLQASS
jgi:hypothetical protein